MPVPDVGASGAGGATNIPSGRGSRILPDPGVDDGAPVHGRETRVNWLLIGLIVFVAFSWLMTFALCRAARLGDEQAARLDAERRAAQQREEERP